MGNGDEVIGRVGGTEVLGVVDQKSGHGPERSVEPRPDGTRPRPRRRREGRGGGVVVDGHAERRRLSGKGHEKRAFEGQLVNLGG